MTTKTNLFFASRFAPLKNFNFCLFFVVRALSLIGRWSHELARSWLILELTGSSKALGSVLLASSIPIALFILKGGTLVDRGDAKKIMLWTQLALGVLVLSLAAFCEWGEIQIWHLIVFAFIEGLIVSFDSPTFLAVVARIVDRKDFQQAMALSSMNFHMGRMLGPLVAGFMLGAWGPSLVFFFDGLTFLIVFLVIFKIKLSPIDKNKPAPKKGDLWYFWKDPKMRYQLGQLTLSMLTIFPIFITVLRTYASQKFNLNSEDFGQLFMLPALGSVLGSFAFAIWKPKLPLKAMALGVPLVFVFYMLLPHLDSLALTAINMSLMGFSAYLMFAALTVGLQMDVKEEFRGRISSLIGLTFGCVGPAAAFPVGAFADTYGQDTALLLFASVFFISSLVWLGLHIKVFKTAVRFA